MNAMAGKRGTQPDEIDGDPREFAFGIHNQHALTTEVPS
jgi:hypothetical protein